MNPLDDLDDEIRDHIDRETQDNIDRGMPPDLARAEARRKFGNVALAKEDARAVWVPVWIDQVLQDLRYAGRALRLSPAGTAIAVVTLALGIGVNTAVFTVFESIVLRPLPYANADRLVHVQQSNAAGVGGISAWVAAEWLARGRSVQSVGLYADGQWNRTSDGDPEVFRGQRVNAAFFDTLGVQPLLGRTLTAEDDGPRRKAVVVLTYELWTSRFGADPAVIERTITLNDELYRIVGVLPSSFHPLHMTNAAEEPRIFAPIGYDPIAAAKCRDCAAYRGVARLREGVSIGQAQTELSAVMGQFRNEFPVDFPAGTTARVRPLKEQMTEALRPALWIALGAAVCVLLIACANLAALQLLHASARTGEFAVRSALGGSPSRVARQLLIETLIISSGGCVLGIAAGQAGLRAVLALAPRELPRLGEIALDTRAFAVAVAACFITGLCAAISPVWLANRVDVNDTLKRHGDRQGRTPGGRARSGLILAEVALAFLLVTTAGLLARTVQGLLRVDAGFDASHVLTLTPNFSTRRGEDAVLNLRRQAVDAVQALPGVRAAGLVNEVPLARTTAFAYRLDTDPADNDPARNIHVFWVEGNYFEALRIPLRQGRLLTRHDGPGTAPAAVVNESFVRRRFPAGDAIGHRITLDDGEPLTIVGVVGDVLNEGLDRTADDAIYQPLAMGPGHYIRLAVRGDGDPAALERSVRAALRAVDPRVAIFHVQSMDDYIASSMAPRRFALALMATFGVLALLLSVIGLYSVIAFSVAMRTAELGIRAALGATRGRLLVMVLRRGLGLVTAGIVTGVVLAAAVTRVVSSLLFAVSALDSLTFAASVVLILCAGAVACLLPAWRASRVDPLTALRRAV